MGYIGEGVTKGNFNALGISFTTVDGKGFQPDSITGAGVYGADSFDNADQIWIWNPLTSGYEMFYYYSDSTHQYDGWYDQGTGEILFSTIHPEGLTVGSSVWYVSHANATGGAANFSGAVDTADTVTLTVNQGNFNLFCNPYPVGLQLNNAEQADWSGASSDGTFDGSDQIWIWNSLTSGYEMWYYYSDSTHQYDGWYDQGTGEIPFETTHPNGLDAGQPVWYVAKGTVGEANTFDVTFKTPVK